MTPEFRYHVASLSAVFLALGIGILVGTAFVGNKIVDRQTKLIGRLEDRVSDQRQETLARERTEEGLKALTPGWLEGRLAGKLVVVIQTGRYSGACEDTERALRLAGAEVLRLSLEDEAWAQIPDRASQAARLGEAMAIGTDPGLLRGDGLVRGDTISAPLHLVVLVGGATAAAAGDASASPLALAQERDAALIETLARRNVRVVGAEPLAAEVSYLRAYRNAGIATVDCVDRPVGAVALVFALLGEDGAFGMRADADRAVPPGAAQR